MGERTAIGWTQSTWNPWHGCRKVSPGCKYCYMYRDKERYGQDPTKVVRSKTTFRNPLKWADPRIIFTCSWSDWFIEEADDWRDDAWEVIRQTPHHTYQILTKRPERIAGRLPWDPYGDPWPNVWLGVSVESEDYLWRTVELGVIPAAVRFISAEPLLGPITFGRALDAMHWVIVGGESGPNGKRRDMKVEWASDIADQCAASGIPLFVKQDSGPKDSLQGRIPDALWARKEMPVARSSTERGEAE